MSTKSWLIRCIDFETTGFEQPVGICEIGWCDVRVNDGVEIARPRSTLCNPGRPIPPEAMGVHDITDEMVAGEPLTAADVLANLLDDVDVFAAHHAEYEAALFGPSVPWLCTRKVAMRCFPEAPDHKLATLRYLRKLPVDPLLCPRLHRAGPDAYVTALLLADMLDLVSIEDMLRWSAGPALQHKMMFGKHRGMTWRDVAMQHPDYLDWIINKMTDEEDREKRANAKYWLRKVAAEQSSENDREPQTANQAP